MVEKKSKKHLDSLLMDWKESVLGKMNESFYQESYGFLRYQGRLIVPNVDDLRSRILEEVHGSRYSIHLGSTKMYHDLREVLWRVFLKRDIVEFVTTCTNCQQVKVDQLKPNGLLQEIQTPPWKLEDINMDYDVGFPRTRMQY